MINIVISLLRIKVVAVLLGPAGVGLVGILQNLMVTASTVSSLGVGNVGTRQIAEAAGRNELAGIDTARRALFWGTLVLAAVGGFVFWTMRHQLAQWVINDPAMADTIGWLSIGVALSIATSAQSALLTGMRRIGDIARAQITSALLFTALGIAAIAWLGDRGLLLYILVVPLTGFIVSHIFVARLPAIQSPRTPLRTLTGQWRTMLRLGIAFMLAGLAGTLGQLAVRTLVQRELGTDALGYFHAAFAISMTYLGFVLGAMGTDYYPRLTAAIHNHDSTNRLVNEQTEVAILLAGPVLLALLALAPWIIQLLYSAEFAPAVTILRWQILGDVLKIASWPLGFVILAAGDGRTFMLTESFAMAIFVGITWLGIPFLGIQATGISFFAMYLFLFPLVYLLARRRTSLRWSTIVKRDFLLLFVSAVLVALAGYFNDWLGAGFGMFAAVIFGIAALVRLAHMAELGGPIGKLSILLRKLMGFHIMCGLKKQLYDDRLVRDVGKLININRKKILCFVRVEAGIGGGDYSILKFVDELAEFHDVLVVVNRGVSKFLPKHKFRMLRVYQFPHYWRGVTRVNSFIWSSYTSILKIASRLNLCQFDFCFGYLRKCALNAVNWASITGSKSVVFHFETPNWLDAELGTNTDGSEFWYSALTAYRNADYLMTISCLSKNMCAEWCGRDGDGVVYPGIERPEINCYSDVREDSIIVVSRMVKSKSLETVLDIAMASNSRPKVIFVGNGPEKATLMKVAGSLPLDVEFMGEVDDKTKWSELSKAKVFLFTSRFEGFGMPPGEALAVGTPCICRDLPILHEVYGESVEYFNTVDDGAQKLDRLLSDYDYWMTMSERGREYIDGRYTWGKAAEMINHVLEQNMLRCDGSQ